MFPLFGCYHPIKEIRLHNCARCGADEDYLRQISIEQAAADITGQLQVRPILYTLYIGINLTIIMKQYGDRQTDTNI